MMHVHSLAEYVEADPVVDKTTEREEQWHAERAGRITCSAFGKLIGTGRNGSTFTQQGLSYLRLKVAERLGSWHSFRAEATDWGRDVEAAAIDAYRKHTGFTVDVQPFRFIALDDEIGGTPDALVNCERGVNAGCLEVKCPWNPAVHIQTLQTRTIPKDYQWQVAGHCLVTKRQWCDFVSFDPRIDGPNRLVVIRWKWDAELLKFLTERLEAAAEWVRTAVNDLQNEVSHAQWLYENDLKLFLTDSKILPARAMCAELCGKMSPTDFKRLRENHCRWWKTVRRRRPSRTVELLSDEWDELRRVVRQVQRSVPQADRRHLTIDDTVLLVSSLGFRTNTDQLRALPERFHFWIES